MNESDAKRAFVKTLRNDDWYVYPHEDHFSTGIPDLSLSKFRKTVWVEVKYFGPEYVQVNGPGRYPLDIAKLHIGGQKKAKLRERQTQELLRLRAKAFDAFYLFFVGSITLKTFVGAIIDPQVIHDVREAESPSFFAFWPIKDLLVILNGIGGVV